jgi:hypothetical protein
MRSATHRYLIDLKSRERSRHGAGNCRAVCVGYDAGRTADANGIQVAVKQVGSMTRLGAEVGHQTDFTKRVRPVTSVAPPLQIGGFAAHFPQ